VDAGSLQTSSNGASVRVAHTASLDTDDQYVEITYAGYEGTGTINVTIAINFQPDESRYEVVYSRSNERTNDCYYAKSPVITQIWDLTLTCHDPLLRALELGLSVTNQT
jgi:hypothetical protein